jgi:hypothetical protein
MNRAGDLEVHDLVWLRFNDDVEARSRVEDVEGDSVWVAIPDEGAFLLHHFTSGEFALQWMAPRGRITQPVRYCGTEQLGVETWRMQKVGEPTVEQLREFVRVEAAIPIKATVRGEESAEPTTLTGITIDISEGGVRCMLTTDDLPPEADATVHLNLEGRALDIPARVLRSVQGLHGRSEVVFTFGPSPHADDVRRFVFATQVRARAASRA